jgi:hypothetical protein
MEDAHSNEATRLTSEFDVAELRLQIAKDELESAWNPVAKFVRGVRLRAVQRHVAELYAEGEAIDYLRAQ